MSPNSNEVQPAPEAALPAEQRPPEQPPAEMAPKGAERAPAPEQASKANATAIATPVAAIPLPLPPAMPAPDQPAPATPLTQANPLQASDDNDLIEKEWVNRAKQIVEQTRDDPYKQSEELTIFKADYMKKRYNKTIKINK